MKTPREILLKRHALAQTRLDAIREQVVAEQVGSSAAPEQAGMLESSRGCVSEILSTNLPLTRPPDTLSPSEGEREWGRGMSRRRRERLRDLGRKLWRELIWPCRRAWCGLGMAWVAILTLNSFTAEPDQAGNGDSTPQFHSLLRFLQEQHRLAAELSEPSLSPTATDPTLRPGPRSERNSDDAGASNVFLGSSRASRVDCGASPQSCASGPPRFGKNSSVEPIGTRPCAVLQA